LRGKVYRVNLTLFDQWKSAVAFPLKLIEEYAVAFMLLWQKNEKGIPILMGCPFLISCVCFEKSGKNIGKC